MPFECARHGAFWRDSEGDHVVTYDGAKVTTFDLAPGVTSVGAPNRSVKLQEIAGTKDYEAVGFSSQSRLRALACIDATSQLQLLELAERGDWKLVNFPGRPTSRASCSAPCWSSFW